MGHRHSQLGVLRGTVHVSRRCRMTVWICQYFITRNNREGWAHLTWDSYCHNVFSVLAITGEMEGGGRKGGRGEETGAMGEKEGSGRGGEKREEGYSAQKKNFQFQCSTMNWHNYNELKFYTLTVH